jgi:hypothetical protein
VGGELSRYHVQQGQKYQAIHASIMLLPGLTLRRTTLSKASRLPSALLQVAKSGANMGKQANTAPP